MKKLIFTILIPLSMVCCQSENEQEVRQFEKPTYKCWYANLSGGNMYGVGRSHTDDYETYNNKVIYLSETTTFNYHCFDSNRYTDKEMKEMIGDTYRK